MTDKPNPADFSVDDKPGQYSVILRISGYMTRTITADSPEEAEEMAEAWADRIADDKEEAELDEVGDVDVDECRRATPMFRVIRGGRPMQVSRLVEGDRPRDPDHRGF